MRSIPLDKKTLKINMFIRQIMRTNLKMSNPKKATCMMLLTMWKDGLSPNTLIEEDCYQSQVWLAFHLECGLNFQDEGPHGKSQYQATA